MSNKSSKAPEHVPALPQEPGTLRNLAEALAVLLGMAAVALCAIAALGSQLSRL